MMLVQNPKQFIKVTFTTFRLFLSTELTYRNQILAWILADIFQPFILAVLWANVARNGSNALSVEQMVTYFFLIAIVSKFTKDFSDQYISNKIMYGEFSKYLVKPFNYLSEALGISMASKFLRLIILIPFLVVTYIFFKDMIIINTSSLNLFYALSAVVIGFIINFLLGNTFALIAFFIKQILGIRSFYENTVTFLSGEVIPIMVMPIWAVILVKVLPFRYTLSFPVEILTNQLFQFEIIQGFYIALFWIISLTIFYKLLYRLALKKYEAEGI
ncbi:ABC-2 family transporter protein [Candidatus Dojkabacteria bacterium]|nr:ABC-2 family transporter protein [Candidatus Dojkabacteria bacterium]